MYLHAHLAFYNITRFPIAIIIISYQISYILSCLPIYTKFIVYSKAVGGTYIHTLASVIISSSHMTHFSHVNNETKINN